MEKSHFNNNELRPRKWLLYVLIVVNIVIVIILANKIMTDRGKDKEESGSIFDNFFNNITDAEDEFDKRSFNSTFEMYVGTEWGSSVSRLIDKVITNNKTNDKHIITVVFNDINSTDSDVIRSIKKSLGDWAEYEVILDYDDKGFVYLVTIEE